MRKYLNVFLAVLSFVFLLHASNINQPSITQAYTTIQDEGTPLTQRATVNFKGAGITCTDNNPVTDCDVPGGGGSVSMGLSFMPATWPVLIGAVANTNSDTTVGVKIVVTQSGQSITGFRVGWASVSMARNVKITLWDMGTGNTGGSSLGTATGAVNATGLYTISFSSPIAVTISHYYLLAMYEDSGTNVMLVPYSKMPNQGGQLLNYYPYTDGPAVIIGTSFFANNDAQPVNGAGDSMPIEPVFQ